MSALILVIDPQPAWRQLLALNLGQAGHRAACAADAETALLLADEARPDLIVLEWDLPGQSGLALIRRLRAQSGTRELPIIMASARCAEADKVLALESGADDYVVKPCGPREMLARMHAVLRRRPPAAQSPLDALHMAGLRLDPGTLRVTAGSRQLALGRVEFRLLNVLMRHPGRVHSRAQLLDQVWGRHAALDERTVDAHVGRLRSALQPSGHHDRIETVRGSGYRFAAARQCAATAA